MRQRKSNLNTIYISERLQKCLQPVSESILTTVIAPMGYGKTTAVNWFLARKQKAEKAVLVRISIYSDNLSIFWRSVQHSFAFAGLDFLNDYECPSDEASAGYLTDVLCHSLAGEQIYYIFIDDFHLLKDNRAAVFLCSLANRLSENVHLVVASRDRFLTGEATLRLGSRLYELTSENLRLNQAELAAYTHKCGTNLGGKQLETLLHSSEGWFSAVYLNLCFFAKWGELPDNNADIYEMFSSSMMKTLSQESQEFLCAMGLADEFTEKMAKFITEREDTEQILQALTEQNAFVTHLSDGKTYRFHHMMKECAERAFSTLDGEKQTIYYNRYGRWYENHGMYIHALNAYWKCRNYDALLSVVQKDAGILLASLKSSEVLDCLSKCPVSVLKEHPLAILVLMRSMFNWKQIPKMLELRGILMAAIQEHPDWTQEECGNLLGECDLIMSFLVYNDISKMSQLHRSASAQMSRPAISIRREGGWTFGSPSVLMMFHRRPGGLAEELQEMKECMPHYYRITNGHGQGAERVMSAEAKYLQGRFLDAQIALENAYVHITDNGQENIALCCDFLAYRLSIGLESVHEKSFEKRRQEILKCHNTSWLNMFDSICAYYYSLTGEETQIPRLFREHKLSTVNFLAPGRPMMELIENQVYLAQGAYMKVIGRCENLLEICRNLHYALVALYIQIQTAAAYEKIGKSAEAGSLLKKVLEEALPDGFVVPFVENYRYLEECLNSVVSQDTKEFISHIMELGKNWEDRCRKLRNTGNYPADFAVLTERELKITQLMGARLSNKEIAAKLFLSEGTVKQYINQIYSKLQITGNTRTKRQHLLELLETKN